MYHTEGFLAVVVVSVDHEERLVDNAEAGKNRMSRAPRLAAALRNRITLRNRGKLLVYVGYGDVFFDAVADGAAEGILDVPANDEDYPVKAGLLRRIDGVIHDDLAAGAHLCKLLDAAAEATAHAGCHNYQRCFHSFLSLLICRFLPRGAALATALFFVPGCICKVRCIA